LFLVEKTFDIYSCVAELKSVSLGSPLLRRKPFEFLFKTRWDGVTGSAKYISMSYLLLTIFQFENLKDY